MSPESLVKRQRAVIIVHVAQTTPLSRTTKRVRQEVPRGLRFRSCPNGGLGKTQRSLHKPRIREIAREDHACKEEDDEHDSASKVLMLSSSRLRTGVCRAEYLANGGAPADDGVADTKDMKLRKRHEDKKKNARHFLLSFFFAFFRTFVSFVSRPPPFTPQ